MFYESQLVFANSEDQNNYTNSEYNICKEFWIELIEEFGGKIQ